MTTKPTDSDAVLRRIRGLLDQAEGTPYPSEAETFAAKAAELMARHHVDQAMLDRSQHHQGGIVEAEIDLGRGPYVRARLQLLGEVTRAYDCRLITSTNPQGRMGHVVGHRPDTEHVSLMYTSLLVQVTRAAAVEPLPPGQHGVTFRRGFMVGFAARVGERLAEQKARATKEANSRSASSGERSGVASAALVLADRRHAVDQWIDENYRNLRRLDHAAPITAEGLARGQHAGGRADLGAPAVRGPRVALGR